MALTETQVEDKIEVVGDHKHVQVRTATVIARDGTEISRSFHRHSLACSTKSGDPAHGVTLTSQVKAQKYKQYAMLFGQTQLRLHTRLQWMHKKYKRRLLCQTHTHGLSLT